MPVPNTRQVIPGATVSIVLKADQRTGREVQGVVKDVLTRGDHHRGIKVRLADGRIGRVQRMGTGKSPGTSEAVTSNSNTRAPGGAGDDVASSTSDALPGARFTAQPGRYRDIRSDEPLEAPQEQIDLSAYIVAPKKKGKGRKGNQARENTIDDQHTPEVAPTDVSSATATCPVCNAFEGDEAAVAHHVAEHFE
ncbi:hypothetical protein BKA67DRAFT_652341 [Truncatella angustata]|uniref:UBZ4-type domain-containing protein n=1 Tax=Truncatella angustata TaxID=152316 RepID=A0A9P8UVQ7_9PEZI|nr:uncharacterized protein BKA67DRAFT_652341 [Truncatella angustata]KAH6659078.1 hypothetical protein BKA67DRAFT_652341 [Truncatella angustata]KAH8201228.1 hypothetical protein TruAng_004618 [Truncatella angustata]